MTILRALVGVIALIVVLVGAVYWYTLGMPGRSYSGPLPALTDQEARMASDMRSYVEAIASRPHNTAHPKELEASAQRIEAFLRSFGYQSKAHTFTASGVEVRNIEVVIEPTTKTSSPGEIQSLVVGAHYDSASTAPGANDNGSGVAALLVLARDLKAHPMRETRLRLVFFVNEEPPHFKTETMGSLVYARALKATGERVRGMLSLETLGSYFDTSGSQRYPSPIDLVLPTVANFVAIVGTPHARPLVSEVARRFRAGTLFPSVAGVAPGTLAGITWSDHWSFEQIGVPAVMITDTALFRYEHYHQTTDTPDKLDYERLARVTAGLLRVIKEMAH